MRRGRLKPIDDAKYHIRLKKDKESLQWKYIGPIKGRGVFACEPIRKGSFILEYRGLLKRNTEPNEYTYFFKHEGTDYCIDASSEDDTLGRLVNDAQKPNSKMKKILVDGKPSLCLFAIVDIEEGQEITYNYGGENLPWRSRQTEKIAEQAKRPGIGNNECKTHHVIKEKLTSMEKCTVCCGPFSSLKWWGLRCQVCATVWHTYCFYSKDKRQKTSPMAPNTVVKPVLCTPAIPPSTGLTSVISSTVLPEEPTAPATVKKPVICPPVASPSLGHSPVISLSTGQFPVASPSASDSPVISLSTDHTRDFSTVLPEEPTAPATVKKPVVCPPVASPSLGHSPVISLSTGQFPVASPSASDSPVISLSTDHTRDFSTVLPEEHTKAQQEGRGQKQKKMLC